MIILGYLTMCLIFGTTFLAIKLGVEAGLPPFLGAGVRFFAAGLLMMLWMAFRRRLSFSLLLRKETLLTGFGLTFCTFAALYWAEQYVSSGLASVLSATGPAFILLLQAGVYRIRIPKLALAGTLIGTAGVALLLLPNSGGGGGRMWLIAGLVIVAGEIGYASGALLAKHASAKLPQASPVALNAAQMMHGGWMLLLLSLAAERGSAGISDLAPALLSLLYLMLVGSMAGHTLFYWLVSRTHPVFPTTWLYVSPFIALALGAWLNGEPLHANAAAGSVVVLAGVLLTNIEPIRLMLRTRKAAAGKGSGG
ncbi:MULTISPECIES: DMT family transporter [Saccharibacillus]|uniref:EamA family transporter n=1 Tax=Saccharibacillus brassicae TaxID=2583377 RepID=A0A4Y6V0Y6_SACBS|nr:MULTISPECIES: EamA family transporter [Saccharibacillus]MWJ30785.1 EamA family transporter [Saccharibacillus sp. WB 17]QDH22316.1 EamA family transporter [Saccharibacillus brassicae]